MPVGIEDVEFLLDALADNFVFDTLDESELETLVEAFENYECGKGEIIVEQGETEGHFYILQSGKVALVADGKEVGRVVPGNSFGELVLQHNAPLAATCTGAVGGAGLWRVDQVTFRKLLAAHTIQNDNQTKDVLRKVPFPSSTTSSSAASPMRSPPCTATSGEQIFERGSEGSVFHVIREGKAECTSTGNAGSRTSGRGTTLGGRPSSRTSRGRPTPRPSRTPLRWRSPGRCRRRCWGRCPR